jgi:hypothetical protein
MSVALEEKKSQEVPPAEPPPNPNEPVFGVTRYDRVTSLLMSLILTISIVAAALGTIWASNRTWIVKRKPAKVEVLEVIDDVLGGGAEDGVLGESLYQPGPDAPMEVSSATNPDEVIADAPLLEERVSEILSAVGTALDNADQLLMVNEIGSSALPVGSRGTGTRRNLGTGPGDGGGVKRHERWEIVFEPGQTELEYARQLDYFGVELGTIVDRKLYLVSRLSSPRPTVRVSPGADEKRLYFSWRAGSRRQIDVNLLRKAPEFPSAEVTVVLQFYPFETEQKLQHLERNYLEANKGTRDLRIIRKSKFAVKRVGGGYDFEITKQEYFGDPRGK